ncbi:low specificity L-threonine aldolase [Mesorhizobium sp.]|uniref:threonine aldolase family protein n=1 Tax=Mesorhizobium sp. TaxID=1871066 RepID=UPI001202219B|nr:GntG family PLP-dependent aldolase [Mesorhizobium sp.]TIS42503.1 MAG: aminotransferase class I/II-fold pyridoxal phosphate-dependent enzyme [Mesorhizobium sp.]
MTSISANVRRIIDLRSDTVTRPTAEMVEAMSCAELGDDFFRDDPTVLAFEEEVADLLGMEAAMLVISGTMGNLVCALSLSPRGSSFIVEASAHIQINESGWPSAIAGLTPKPVEGVAGTIGVDALQQAIAEAKLRLSAPPRLLCLENTHNAAGGRITEPEHLAALADIAHASGLRVHLDGARIFNAAVALGRPVRDLTKHADTATFCLSKGLSCPLGAVVAGGADAVQEARRWRQVVGGGMRQAGIIAAAGRVALNSMVERLAVDHDNAKLLATRLRDASLDVDVEAVETNIIFAKVPGGFDYDFFQSDVRASGIVIMPPKAGRIRLVTHREVSAPDIVFASDMIAKAFDLARRQAPSADARMAVPNAVY